MQLDTTIRTRLVERLLHDLPEAVPGSAAHLRGSLADHRADVYSDIDMLWEIPDPQFTRSVNRVPTLLTAIHPCESLRFDPDFQQSHKRRLIFVRFRDVPLFWRLDLDILATSLCGNLSYDINNPDARGTAWSLTESALANVIAAMKAHVRQQDDTARQLLLRAYQRVAVSGAPDDIATMVFHLTATIPTLDPATIRFATRIMDLANEIWPLHQHANAAQPALGEKPSLFQHHGLGAGSGSCTGVSV
jgi:hypothetical protein